MYQSCCNSTLEYTFDVRDHIGGDFKCKYPYTPIKTTTVGQTTIA